LAFGAAYFEVPRGNSDTHDVRSRDKAVVVPPVPMLRRAIRHIRAGD